MPIKPETIINVVCDQYGVSRAELNARNGRARMNLPRFTAMHLMFDMTPLAMKEVGELLGARDKSTVHHAVKRSKQMADCDEKYARELSEIRGRVKLISYSRKQHDSSIA